MNHEDAIGKYIRSECRIFVLYYSSSEICEFSSAVLDEECVKRGFLLSVLLRLRIFAILFAMIKSIVLEV